jgi:hypothetical protein
MPTTPLFPLAEGLEITTVSDTPEEVLVRVTSHRATSLCQFFSTPPLLFTVTTAVTHWTCRVCVALFGCC